MINLACRLPNVLGPVLCLDLEFRSCQPVPCISNYVYLSRKLMPYFVMDILGELPGLPGLFVACAFSGTLRLHVYTFQLRGALQLLQKNFAVFPLNGFIARCEMNH